MLYRFLSFPYVLVLLFGGILLLWDIVCAFRSKKSPAEGAAWLWRTNHWLGTEKGSEKRLLAGRLCFLLAMLAYLAWNTLSNAALPASASFVVEILFDAFLLLSLLKIVCFTDYGYGRFALVLLCLLPLFGAAALAQNMVFLATFLLLLAAKNVDMRPVLQAGAALTAVLAAGVILCQRLGILPMDGLPVDSYVREVQHKYALGFIHPNTTGYILAFLAAAWYLLRYSRIKWWDICGILGLTAVIGFAAKSRASMLTVLIMLLFGGALRRLRGLRRKTWLHILLCTIPGMLAFLSFFAAVFYDEYSALWVKINSAVSGRIYLNQETMRAFGPTLFGQDIRTETLFTMDNVYLYLFYRMGVLCFALFLLGMTLLLWHFLKQECYGEAAVLISFLCMGLMECVAFWPAVNLAMWQLPALLWNEKVLPLCESRHEPGAPLPQR